MARLFTSGFEVQITSTNASYNGEAELGAPNLGSVAAGTPTFNTTDQRSGAACLSCAATNTYNQWNTALVLDRTYYLRGYFRVQALPLGAATNLIVVLANSVGIAHVQLTTSSTLQLVDNTGNVGSPSPAISAGTWYRIELEFMIPTAGAGIAGFYLDGTQIARSTSADTNNSIAATTAVRLGAGGSPAQTILVDDVALNDSTGADQNTFPGSGKIVLLKPVSHSSIGNWVGPQTTGDDTTSLNDNVDNTPPLGVAHSDADANAGKYAFNAVSSANNNFDLNVTDYTTAGIGASDTVMLCQALARVSVNTTSGTNTGAVAGVSNPAITATTGYNLETIAVAGTEATGWKSVRTNPVYAPSVTKGTSPVVRVQKEVANTNAAMVDLMGLLVEYQPIQSISADRRVVYDIEPSAVAADRAVVYSIKNSVSADRQVPYSIQGQVAGDRRVVYSIIAAVTADRRIVYSMQGAVAATRQIVYGITSTVTADRAVVYAITNTVAADRALVYGIIGLAVADRAILYTIRAIPATDPTLRYTRSATLSAHPFAPGQVVGVYRADEASLRYVRQGDLPPSAPLSTVTVDSENRLEVSAELGRVLLAAETGQTVNRRPTDTYPTAQPEVRYTTLTIP